MHRQSGGLFRLFSRKVLIYQPEEFTGQLFSAIFCLDLIHSYLLSFEISKQPVLFLLPQTSYLHNYKTYSDEQLVALLKDGDRDAFTEIYNRYWEHLLALAVAKLKSVSDAKEAVQLVFIQTWQRRERINIAYSLQAYLSGAVRFHIIDILEQQYKSSDLHTANENTASFPSSEEWIAQYELRERIEKGIKQLPEKCRLVFQMSRQEGFSQKEVASKLGISEKTVEAHLAKANRLLRLSLRQFFSFLF